MKNVRNVYDIIGEKFARNNSLGDSDIQARSLKGI
jgi:hypothetical protein